MCGIAGFLDLDGGNVADAEATARAMAATLRARGPDDAGAWSDGSVALGFRRLAIVDLSPLGHQPMASASRRYTIVFNGEVRQSSTPARNADQRRRTNVGSR